MQAFAQTVSIGATDFPLGENAFPIAAECLDAAGCGSSDNVLVDATDPLFPSVSPANALLGSRLDLVSLDLDATDEIRLTFPVPVVNQPGADIYLAQVLFIDTLDGLGDAQGINDVGVRFGGADPWTTLPLMSFTGDLTLTGPVFVTYQDPELKQDAYAVQDNPPNPPLAGLWFIELDMTDFGFAADDAVSELRIRGSVNLGGSGLDAVAVGNLNANPTGNMPPIAVADDFAGVEDQAIDVAPPGVLGNDSDPDGDSLTAVLEAGPANGMLQLDADGSFSYVPNADFNGSDSFRYRASDGAADSAAVTVGLTVSAVNDAPVADAGADQSVSVGVNVQLDGTGASDVDGDLLTYRWSLTSVPAGSAATLSDPAVALPTFAVDLPGTYVAELVVNDGLVDSLPDTVAVTTRNSAPVAAAGADQSVLVGATVQLDGSGSSDVDGDPLTYRWSLVSVPAGSGAMLSSTSAVMPTFTVDLAGSYVAQLIVNDGLADSPPDTVTVTTQNSAPVAAAGADQSVAVGATVQLDGTGSSDVDGDSLTYRWSLTSVPAGSAALLSDTAAAMPVFTVDLPGTYIAQLIVNDGRLDSPPDSVTVNASAQNTAPVAAAGADQSGIVGATVQLDGTGSSDVDGDLLTYRWSLTSVPSGSGATLLDASSPMPTFTLDFAGSYVAQLVVNDGLVDSLPDSVIVTTQNSAPVADAGADQSVAVGATVHLDGTASLDADGDALTYRWSFTAVPPGSAATLSDPVSAMPNFAVDLAGSYVAQLTVNDGQQNSLPDTVIVTTQNAAPVADAGADQSVAVGAIVQLDGGGSNDANGDPLTFHWSLASVPAGSAAMVSNPGSAMPTFAVDLPGTYVAQLIVDDGQLHSNPDTATVTTQNSMPVADAGADQNVTVGATVQLDGTGSSDADGDTLSYRWLLASTPAGSAAALSDTTSATPSFEADVAGSYVAQLIVNDGSADSAPVTVSVAAAARSQVSRRGGGGGGVFLMELFMILLALLGRRSSPGERRCRWPGPDPATVSPAARRSAGGRRMLVNNRIWAACALLVLATVALQPAQAARYRLDFGGDFTLTNTEGQAYSLGDARGKVVLISFGFTSCPDICPLTLFKIAGALRQLGPLAERVETLFVSVDTQRDTPEILRNYANSIHPSIIALTGTQEEVEAVAAQYRTPVLVRKPNEGGFYLVDHGSRLFFVDPEGVLANIAMYESSSDDIVRKVKELLPE